MNFRKKLCVFVALAALSCGLSWAEDLPDPLAAGWRGKPVCENLHEDDKQRVLRCTFAPGVGHERHYHSAHFGYALSGGRMQLVDATGSREAELKTDSSFTSQGTPWHEVYNIGDTTVSYLIVETKPQIIPSQDRQCVVLLHGLARTASAMNDLQEALLIEGYHVENVDYPSTDHAIERLAPMAVGEGLRRCAAADASPVHFVTHSLGGILVRKYYQDNASQLPGRVVMLGPPNQGSEVVDNIANLPGFELYNGPAGVQLGTTENSLPRTLGPVSFDLGVIAGTRSINPLLSTFLPDPDDGKVSVESTRVEGMCAHLQLPVNHTFMMQSESVIAQVLSFLDTGEFQASDVETFKCLVRSS